MNHLFNFELHEYLNNKNTIDLYKYMKMQQPEIVLSLPYKYSEWYDNYIYETQTKDWDFYDLPDYDDTSTNIEEVLASRKEYMNSLYQNDRQAFIKFGNWIFDKLGSNTFEIDEKDYPTWIYLKYENIVKPNTWLLHFTRETYAADIMENGFIHGLSDMTRLGLTTHFDKKEKEAGGYNFAYTVEDAKEFNPNLNNYGDTKNVIMFKASGLRAFHTGDDEFQVLYDGRSAKDLIWLRRNEKGLWQIENFPSIQKKTLYELVDWVELHYYQYRKRLS